MRESRRFAIQGGVELFVEKESVEEELIVDVPFASRPGRPGCVQRVISMSQVPVIAVSRVRSTEGLCASAGPAARSVAVMAQTKRFMGKK